MKNKITEFIKTKPIIAWAVGTVAVALVVALAVSAVFFAVGSDESEVSEGGFADMKWGEGITEGIPEFSPSSDTAKSVKGNETSVSAYFSEVTGEQVNAYTLLIEEQCGIKFSSDKYPRLAIFGDRIIAIHYNVTEMKMSVTVVKNGDTDK